MGDHLPAFFRRKTLPFEVIHSKRSDRQFTHTLLTSEILASIELEVRDHPGLYFVSSTEILARTPQYGVETLYPLALPAPGERGRPVHVVLDGLFGLEYVDGEKMSCRFFVLGLDRATCHCGGDPQDALGSAQSPGFDCCVLSQPDGEHESHIRKGCKGEQGISLQGTRPVACIGMFERAG